MISTTCSLLEIQMSSKPALDVSMLLHRFGFDLLIVVCNDVHMCTCVHVHVHMCNDVHNEIGCRELSSVRRLLLNISFHITIVKSAHHMFNSTNTYTHCVIYILLSNV